MKKLILLSTLFISTLTFSQTLASKTFAKDTATDLKPQINVWQITIDAKAKTITYVYDIVNVNPRNSKSIYVEDTKTYTRKNISKVDSAGITIKPASNKYNNFINGTAGVAIIAEIQAELNNIAKKDEDVKLIQK